MSVVSPRDEHFADQSSAQTSEHSQRDVFSRDETTERHGSQPIHRHRPADDRILFGTTK